MAFLRKLWELWKAFAHVLGRIQTAILLAIIYHIAVGPIGLVCRLTRRDLLGLRSTEGDSFSVDSPPISTTLEQAQKQF
jgi:hypothetical protein